MQAEIVMIGTELLLGQIQDTNATYMARVLAENGINLYQKTTVGDNAGRIAGVLNAALNRTDVVLCSGGLGPTEDDITRDCVAEVLNRPLEYRPELFEAICRRFAHTNRKITGNNKKQATLPRDAIVLENPHGTAPGFMVDDARGIIACMPGVPSELKPMLEERIIPWLRARFGQAGVLHYRVLKVCGMGESRVDSMLGDLIQAHENPTIGLLASPEAVRIRIAARAPAREAAEALIAPVESQVRERLGDTIMGADEDTLEMVVDQLLAARGWRLAVAETHSGGMLAQRLAASEAASFGGALVLPDSPERTGADEAAMRQRGFDLASEISVKYTTQCALVLLSMPGEQRTWALFRTPAGDHEWEIGRYGRRERSQLRTAIIALEHIRRALVRMEKRA